MVLYLVLCVAALLRSIISIQNISMLIHIVSDCNRKFMIVPMESLVCIHFAVVATKEVQASHIGSSFWLSSFNKGLDEKKEILYLT